MINISKSHKQNVNSTTYFEDWIENEALNTHLNKWKLKKTGTELVFDHLLIELTLWIAKCMLWAAIEYFAAGMNGTIPSSAHVEY